MKYVAFPWLCALAWLASLPAVAQVAVTTHLYDSARTGLNPHETVLTPATVANGTGPTAFGLLHVVPLSGQADAQPLVVPNLAVTGDPHPDGHDVVFVATEANVVYAIDPVRGTIIRQRAFNPPVPWPQQCGDRTMVVGINGTPVIDRATDSLYVMVYHAIPGGTPASQYVLHRLSLHDLSDVVPPRVVSATQTLTDGSTFTFDADYSRQRPALLFSAGAIYAGFGSFCDFHDNVSRGWLLGWRADTLAPLAYKTAPTRQVKLLTDRLASTPNEFFLSSIWMSGAGPAADLNGNVFFTTGNSDRTGGPHGSYNGVTNIQESVVKFSPSSDTVLSLFTPSNVEQMDATDADLGSGGVLLVPPQSLPGLPPRLAVAGGKDGRLFLLNRDSLGGFQKGPGGTDNVVGVAELRGGCFCSPIYLNAGKPQVAAAGGDTVTVFDLTAKGGLKQAGYASFHNGQDGSFEITASSSGTSNTVLWTVSHPDDATTFSMYLRAFSAVPDPATQALPNLFTGLAGHWPNAQGNANIVPVVANGRVYVATYRQLMIFGLGAAPDAAAKAAVTVPPVAADASRVTGIIAARDGATLRLDTRDGVAVVDAAAAIAAKSVPVVLAPGAAVVATGRRAHGVLQATAIGRAKTARSSWAPDQ